MSAPLYTLLLVNYFPLLPLKLFQTLAQAELPFLSLSNDLAFYFSEEIRSCGVAKSPTSGQFLSFFPFLPRGTPCLKADLSLA